MRRIISIVVRVVLSMTLLVFVWLNAHWSVALIMTLITLRFELEDYSKQKEMK